MSAYIVSYGGQPFVVMKLIVLFEHEANDMCVCSFLTFIIVKFHKTKRAQHCFNGICL